MKTETTLRAEYNPSLPHLYMAFELSRWDQKRFGQGGKRLRQIGIVAVARKRLSDGWMYLETGLVPEGVELKTRLF